MYRPIKFVIAVFLIAAAAGMLAVPSSASRRQPTEAFTNPAPDRGRFEITLFKFFVGRQTLENAIEFAGAGDEVSFSRMPHDEGWVAIRVLSPNIYESNHAKFVLDCKRGSEKQALS